MNVRPETIKLLEENTGSMLFAIGLSNIFLSMYLQAKETETKIDKWDDIKLKSFISDKGLLSKIYKELIQLNNKKNKQPNFKMGRGPEETFFQRRHTDS